MSELINQYNADVDSWIKEKTEEGSVLQDNIVELFKRAAAMAPLILANLPGYAEGKVLTATADGFKWETPASGGSETPQLGTPTVTATAVSASQINLNWTAVTNATTYTVKRSTSSNMSGATTIYTGSGTSYSDTGRSGSTTYYYSVTPSASGYLDGTAGTANATTPASNASPTVTLSLSASEVIAGGTVTLTAVPSDSDGTISKVEFFADGSKIGEDLSSPYTFDYTPSVAGTDSMMARATDDDGATGDSAAQTLTVRPNFNTTINAGETSVDGVGLTIPEGTGNFKYDSPFPAGDPFAAVMAIYIGGVQVALVDFITPGIGQQCSFTYNGTTYYTTFINEDRNL